MELLSQNKDTLHLIKYIYNFKVILKEHKTLSLLSDYAVTSVVRIHSKVH
jgi:hypothetical protein